MSIYPFPKPEESRQSVPDLIRQLFQEMTELLQQHIQLTKVEARAETQRVAKASIFGGMAVVLALVGLIFLGNIVAATLLQRGFSPIGAHTMVMSIFMLLAVVCAGLCKAHVKSAQTRLKKSYRKTFRRKSHS